MAGRGSRFKKDGFFIPKPLIPVCGKPMVEVAIKSLMLNFCKYHFVIFKDEYVNDIKSVIYNTVNSPLFKEIDYITKGPASSALLFKDEINNLEELVIANCDQVMSWNPHIFLHNCRLYDGCVVTYNSDTVKNSYAKVDNNGKVVQIKEKEVISNISLNGIHYWKHGKDFIKSAEEMIKNNDTVDNEFYIAPTYNYMIKDGYNIGIYHIPNEYHNAVGTPEDLIKYEIKENVNI